MKTIILHKCDLTTHAKEVGVWDSILEAIGLDDSVADKYQEDDAKVEIMVHSGTADN